MTHSFLPLRFRYGKYLAAIARTGDGLAQRFVLPVMFKVLAIEQQDGEQGEGYSASRGGLIAWREVIFHPRLVLSGERAGPSCQRYGGRIV